MHLLRGAMLRRIQENDKEANDRHRRMLVYTSYQYL